MKILQPRSLLLTALAILPALDAPAAPPEINVFAAASLADVLKEIAARYPAAQLISNLAASSLLERQIEQGAPADLFISADEAKMNLLEKKGLLVPGTRADLLGNTLVIVAPADSATPLARVQDLLAQKEAKITIGQPDTVPAGIYAKQYLTAQGLWQPLHDQLVPTDSVRAALAGVESGNAQYGIIYRTDAQISHQVKIVFAVPAAAGPKIVYPVAEIKNPDRPRNPAVAAFELYLRSPAAAAIFQKYGFTVFPSNPNPSSSSSSTP